MDNFISKIIPLRSNEKQPFWFCFAINFCMGLSFIIGSSVSESLFLKEYGADKLPMMLVINALVMIMLFPLYDYCSDRLGSNRIYYLACGVFSCILLVGAIALMSENNPPQIYPILYCISVVSASFLYMHFNTYLIDFFNTLQTKRLLSYIFSAIIFGTIIGGFAITIFMNSCGISMLLIIWSILLFAICVLVFFNRNNRTYNNRPYVSKDDEPRFAFLNSFKTIKSSRFLLITLFAYFVGDLTISGAEIISHTLFANSPLFPDAESLAKFYALFGAFSSICILGFQFLILPNLIRYEGVSVINLILPLIFLISLGGLAFGAILPVLILPFAALNRFNVSFGAEYVEPVASNLIFSALPSDQKKKILSIYGGLAEPCGPIVTGLLLNILFAIFSTIQLAMIFFFLALGYLICTLWQNSLYTKELINLVKNQHFDLFKAASEGMSNVSNGIQEALMSNLKSEHENEAIISAQIMADIAGPEVLETFSKVIHTSSPTLQAEILNIFARMGESAQYSGEAIDCVLKFLQSEHPNVKQHAILALNTLDKKSLMINIVTTLMNDPDPKTACLAAIYVLNRNVVDSNFEQSKSIVSKILTSDRATALIGVRTLSGLNNASNKVLDWLFDLVKQNTPVQKEIARMVLELFTSRKNDQNWNRYSNMAHELVKHNIREVRLLGLMILKNTNQITDEELIFSMGDRFENIRELVRSFFIENKNEIIILKPNDIRKFWNGKYNIYVWESLLLISAEFTKIRSGVEISELIYIAVHKASEILSYIICLDKELIGDQYNLFKGVVRDHFRFAIKTSIKLVEYLGKDHTFQIMKKSLESTNQRIQADALETLNNLPSKGIGKVIAILELLIGNLPNEEKIGLLKQVDNLEQKKLEDILLIYLNNEDEWECAITVHTVLTLKKCSKEFSNEFDKNFMFFLGSDTVRQKPYIAELITTFLNKMVECTPDETNKAINNEVIARY